MWKKHPIYTNYELNEKGLIRNVKLKSIADKYPEYNNKKLYNTIKKINSGKLYKDLVKEITDKRSTTIEKDTFIFKIKYLK